MYVSGRGTSRCNRPPWRPRSSAASDRSTRPAARGSGRGTATASPRRGGSSTRPARSRIWRTERRDAFRSGMLEGEGDGMSPRVGGEPGQRIAYAGVGAALGAVFTLGWLALTTAAEVGPVWHVWAVLAVGITLGAGLGLWLLRLRTLTA